ncbi:MAG TPA: Fic family protein, partial [Verrucomicrobiae bacterium]
MVDALHSRLADALERAIKMAEKQVVRSAALSRSDREILLDRGYLQEVFKGWYLLRKPGDKAGDSTAWYSTFWDFLSVYMEERFGTDYCLSASSSIDAHTGANLIPAQVIAMTARGGKMLLKLPHNTSIMVYQDEKNLPGTVEVVNGVRVMPLALALCRMPPTFFENQPVSAEIALRAVKSVDDLARVFLEMNSPTLAGRLVGAYEFLGDKGRATQLASTARAAGMKLDPVNPFVREKPILTGKPRLISPCVGRIQALFSTMRDPVIELFKDMPPRHVSAPDQYLQNVDAVYEQDAYNSLSIEGYRVTHELIAKIRAGTWDPDGDPQDKQQRDAMAAKGYLTAFQLVQKAVKRVLDGESAARVARTGYQDWYRALFSETVKAGLLQSADLAGHRNMPVYIRTSRHVPPPYTALSDAMSALFDLLELEEHAIVRAILGHWLFGFIHPFNDGNGRIARFLMNVMMASGGYPWTIVRMERRSQYLAGLEAASVEHNILP